MTDTGADSRDLHVAAGVLQDTSGRVLVAQRQDGKPMAGAWEFPGGKIGSGETPLQGLVRELQEELGIGVRYARHLLRYSYQYPERLVHLYVWKVLDWQGDVTGEEGQALKWVYPAELMQAGLLVADEPVAHFLQQSVPVNTAGGFAGQ